MKLIRALVASIILITLTTSSAAASQTHLQEFTSSRCVTSMCVTKDGTLWAGTRGGILKRDAAGKWTKQTTQDGLPSNEVRQVFINKDGAIKVLFPDTSAVWKGGKWRVYKSTFIAPKQYQFPKTQWQGKTVQAGWNGLQIGKRHVKMPPSKGSYISALLPQGKVLLVAIYGDGIWSFDGAKWKKLYKASIEATSPERSRRDGISAPLSDRLSLPAKARQITALAFDDAAKVLFVGTRREGVWMFDGKSWKQHLQDNEPYNTDIQSLIAFRGNFFAGTLEDGLLEYQKDKWRHFGADVLSSNAPRQMAVFQHNLYVRFGNGMVDRFDGKEWKRNVFPHLPRGKVYSIAADNKKLYLGQWGGWSEWDGKTFRHFLKIPELQGVPVMLLLPHQKQLYIGTQSLGLLVYHHQSQKLKTIDARAGLPDDWITALAFQEHLYIGTFVGGLTQYSNDAIKVLLPVKGENITSLAADSHHGLYVATRHGAWHFDGENKWQNLQDEYPALAPEAQALLETPQGLWIGTRTGLFLLSRVKGHL